LIELNVVFDEGFESMGLDLDVVVEVIEVSKRQAEELENS